MSVLNFSEKESEQLGLKLYRTEELNDISSVDLLDEIFQKKADVVRLKIPFKHAEIFEQIENTAFPYNIFKSLIRMTVYKETKNLYKHTNQELEFKPYTVAKEDVLRSLLTYGLSESTEIGFTNSIYTAIIDKEKMIDLSTEYYISLANKGQQAGYFFYLVFIKDECVGLCSFQIKDKKSEGLFYTVKPEFRSSGLAKELLSYARENSFLNGAEEFSTNTIIQNPRSVYPQMKIGLVPNETYMNVLLFPLLSKPSVIQTELKTDSLTDLYVQVNMWLKDNGYSSVHFKQIKNNVSKNSVFPTLVSIKLFVFKQKVIVSAWFSDNKSCVYFIGDFMDTV